MSSFESSTHHLAGSGNETGGLIKKKKSNEVDKKSKEGEFKKPSGSLLGLDVLARRKREQREAEEGGKFTTKRPKYDRDNKREQYDSDLRISFGKSDTSKERRYRAPLQETPTHTGGVSEEAMERMHHRMKREQGQGLYASTGRAGDRNQERQYR